MRHIARFACLLGCAFGLSCLLARPAFAADEKGKGLYADEGKDATKGDLDDQDYWWARWDAKMLEDAIKTHQPEGPISVNVAVGLRRLNDLAKKYPKHEEIKKMQARFQQIQDKLDPNANRRDSWKPGFPWDMSNYAQAWVNWHWGKMAYDANDAERAFGLYGNVVQNFRLITEKADLFKDMPEECHKFVEENKPKAEKIYAELKEKTHH
jgi:hypothetical protein